MASSNFIVSAIKYRPGTFAEVLAQDHITRTLRHSLKRGHIANAYLFSGPRGTGKTTTARILAKALNCENLQDGEPCNHCSPCREIARGTHPDVLEIDAASNTGVENIRELRANARFTPSSGKFKIFIIDECHMLSTAANNALLKTLEEPPPHCRFIFATTEIQKILPTILSRCQRYPFRRIPAQVIVEHLRHILAQQSEIQIAESSQLDRILFLLARSSEGCLRDALFALDQLLAFCSGTLDFSEVQEVMGAIEFDMLDRYVRALIGHDLPAILEIIETLSNHGKEISLFLAECLFFLRNLAVIKIAPQNLELLDLPDDYRKQLAETAELAPLEQILYITDQLWGAEQRIRYSALGRIIMEMVSIKAAKAGQAVQIEDLIKKISTGGGFSQPFPASSAFTAPISTVKPAVSKPATIDPSPAGGSRSISPSKMQDGLLDTMDSPESSREGNDAPVSDLKTSPPVSPHPPHTPSSSLSTLWNQFLKELEAEQPMLAGALENSVALDIDNDVLRIAIPSDNLFGLRTIERPNNQQSLSRLLQQAFGKKLSLQCEASEELNRINEQFSPEKTVPSPAVSRQELMEKVQQNRILNKLMEEMPGRIVDIKPGG